jgi:predicted AAA+ superfamily ATPase
VNKNNSRWIAPVLSRALSVFPVVVVAGARQVGKTISVRELCPVVKALICDRLPEKFKKCIALHFL